MGQITIILNICDVCGHRWLSDGTPKRCAKCKASRWNVAGAVVYETGADEAKPGTDRTVETIMHQSESSDDGIAEGYEDAEQDALSSQARAKREQKKADRAARKAELRESVAQAVKNPPRAPRYAGRAQERFHKEGNRLGPARIGGGTFLDATSPEPSTGKGKASVEVYQGCGHPANMRTGGKSWRCAACGYRHKAEVV